MTNCSWAPSPEPSPGIRAGGMDVDGSLTLKRAPVVPDTDANRDSVTGFDGDVDAGTLAGRSMVGNWGGQFYGPNKASGKACIETEYPTTAAGTFGADSPGHRDIRPDQNPGRVRHVEG